MRDYVLKTVLIVEDDLIQQKMLHNLLKNKLGFASCTASNGKEALDVLKEEKHKEIKVVIMDIDMPVMDGMETLNLIRQRYPFLPVIMVTATHDVEKAVEAMRLGAIDFLTKPYDVERLSITVKNALKISTLSKEVKRLKTENEGRFCFENLIGYENGLSDVVMMGRKAASCDIPVLITGETGVGKEVFSNAIHGDGHRAGKPFIAINCGAIPSQLVESTLFGHEKGAFTGATEKAIGKFREAQGGTIFLDEIGELPLEAQVKLLRVLQQREVEPVGASKPVSVDVRIISATNRDLKKEIKAGNFREDLYFRLNVLEIELPALRERHQDIPDLVHHFIDRFSTEGFMAPCTVTDKAMSYLKQYNWPGNIRELENLISRAIVLSQDNILDVDDFSSTIGLQKLNDGHVGGLKNDEYSVFDATGELKHMDLIERELIQLALEKFDHNIAQAAQAIGMAKSTFYRKISVN